LGANQALRISQVRVGRGPTDLIRDRDARYGHAVRRRLVAMGIRDHPIAPVAVAKMRQPIDPSSNLDSSSRGRFSVGFIINTFGCSSRRQS
jgi:Fe2+ transport system protein FeoA